jgi:hypothetical protein
MLFGDEEQKEPSLWDGVSAKGSGLWDDATVCAPFPEAALMHDEATSVSAVCAASWLQPSPEQPWLKPIPLNATETCLGRGVVCEPEGVCSVSRVHAKTVAYVEGCFLYDEGSKNGTFINGEKVLQDGSLLRHGDLVTLGKATFVYEEIRGGFRGFLPKPAGVCSAVGFMENEACKTAQEQPYVAKAPRLSRRALVWAVVCTVCVALGVVYAHRTWGAGSALRAHAVEVHFRKGLEAFKASRWEEAQREISIVRSLDPDHKESVRVLKEIAEAQKR